MTTVGVIVTVHNGAETIAQALASVAGQTRLPDTVVVVDDGSTDDTVARVEPWRALLPLEIVRHETNQGVSAGRMSAMARLDTDVVLAIDADDVWLPDHLTRLLDAYSARPGIVSPMAVVWRPGSARSVDWHRRLQEAPDRPDLERLLLMNWIFAGSLFERAAFDAAGGFYRFRAAEDWDLWLRMLSAGVPVSLLDQPTVLYRVHTANLSADDGVLSGEIEVLKAFLAEHADPGLRAVARRSLRHRAARVALRTAYEDARQGRMAASRSAALRTLLGPGAVVRRGAAMVVAPRLTARRRDQAHAARAS